MIDRAFTEVVAKQYDRWVGAGGLCEQGDFVVVPGPAAALLAVSGDLRVHQSE